MARWQDTWADLFVEADAAKERAKEDFLKSIGSPTVMPLDKVTQLADRMTAASWRALLNHIGPISSDDSIIVDTKIVDGVKKLDLRSVQSTPEAQATGLAFKTASAVSFRTEEYQELYSLEPPPHLYTIGGKTFRVQNQVTGGYPILTGPSSPTAENGALYWPDNTWSAYPIVQAKLVDLGVPDLSRLAELWLFVEFFPPPGDSVAYQKLIFGVSPAPDVYGHSDLQFLATKTSYNNTQSSTSKGQMYSVGTTGGTTPSRVDDHTVMAMRVLPGCVEIYSGVPYSFAGDAHLTAVSFVSLRAQMKRLGVLVPSNADRGASLAAAWADGTDLSLFMTNDSNRVSSDGPVWRAVRVDYLEAGLIGAGSVDKPSLAFEEVSTSSGLAQLSLERRSVKLGGTEDLLGMSTTGLAEGAEETVYFVDGRTVQHQESVGSGYAPLLLQGSTYAVVTPKTILRFKLINDGGLVWRQIGGSYA